MEEQKPEEVKTETPPEAPKPPENNKRWGMAEAEVGQFFYLVFLGLERMSQCQRTFFRRNVKAACRDLNALWPHGKPLEVIAEEAKRAAAEHAAKPKLIIPEGVNADALKTKE